MLSVIFQLHCVGFLTVALIKSSGVRASTSSLSIQSVNTFEYNWMEVVQKTSRSVEFSPPSSKDSKFIWVPGSFGHCFGCGVRSYREVSHDCVHRLPINLTMDAYSKSLVGLFKVSDEECLRRIGNPPAQRNLMGCGPPCSQLRLLRGEPTGCRCLNEREMAFAVPHLTCQNTENRTVSLSLCKTLYEMSPRTYMAIPCDFNAVCAQPSEWVVGNWTLCSKENAQYQQREVVCATRVPNGVYLVMHKSMCVKSARLVVNQYCARWAAEKNFKCDCRSYNAKRIVICLRVRGRGKKRVPDSECGWHDKPQDSRACTDAERSRCRRRY